MQRLIEVENLTLQFRTDEGLITAVENVSFSLESGEVMGLVGERVRQVCDGEGDDASECLECRLW